MHVGDEVLVMIDDVVSVMLSVVLVNNDSHSKTLSKISLNFFNRFVKWFLRWIDLQLARWESAQSFAWLNIKFFIAQLLKRGSESEFITSSIILSSTRKSLKIRMTSGVHQVNITTKSLNDTFTNPFVRNIFNIKLKIKKN